MAISNPPIALQNAGNTHTAEMLRNAFNGMMAGPRAASSLIASAGVAPFLGAAMAVTQSGSPAMNVSVAPGIVFVPGTESSQQGVYACLNQTATTVTVTASNGSLPRIDLIVARVYDSAYSGATNVWALEVVTGTAAASPVAPTAPNNTIILAQLAIAAASTQVLNANITDKRTYAPVGYTLCTSTTRPVAPVANMVILETDTGKLLRYTGTAYVPAYEQEVTVRSSTTSSSAAVGTTTTAVVTLGSTTFKANRAYEVRINGAVQHTVASAFSSWEIRKTSSVGTQILNYPRPPILGNTLEFAVPFPDRIFTVGASDVTAVLCLCITSSSGSTVLHTASATYPRGLLIRDVGPSSAYSGEVVLS